MSCVHHTCAGRAFRRRNAPTRGVSSRNSLFRHLRVLLGFVLLASVSGFGVGHADQAPLGDLLLHDQSAGLVGLEVVTNDLDEIAATPEHLPSQPRSRLFELIAHSAHCCRHHARQLVDHRCPRIGIAPVDAKSTLGALGEQQRHVPLLGHTLERAASRPCPQRSKLAQPVTQQANRVEHRAVAPHGSAVGGPHRASADDPLVTTQPNDMLVKKLVAAQSAVRVPAQHEALEVPQRLLTRRRYSKLEPHRRTPLGIVLSPPHRRKPGHPLLAPTQHEQRNQHERRPGVPPCEPFAAPSLEEPRREQLRPMTAKQPRHRPFLQATRLDELGFEERGLCERAAGHLQSFPEPLASGTAMRHSRIGSVCCVVFGT